MTRLLLIRHGLPEAGWGSAGSDPGLSDIGRKQAESTAEALRRYGPLDVVSSPMRRCLETASPYAMWRGRAPTVEVRVSEVVSDQAVTHRAAWLRERFPWRPGEQPRLWSSLEPRLRDWRARMLAYVSALKRDTAVFTHFIAINVIAGAAVGAEETIVCRPNHCSITEVGIDGGILSLIRFGDDMAVDDVR